MEILPMVSMALSNEEKQDSCMPFACDQPNYPYGLSISLCNRELEKLGIDYQDVDVNDILHMHCFAVVTSKSSNVVQGTDPTFRIELQVTHISSEDEANEDKEEEKVMSSSKKISKLYNS